MSVKENGRLYELMKDHEAARKELAFIIAYIKRCIGAEGADNPALSPFVHSVFEDLLEEKQEPEQRVLYHTLRLYLIMVLMGKFKEVAAMEQQTYGDSTILCVRRDAAALFFDNLVPWVEQDYQKTFSAHIDKELGMSSAVVMVEEGANKFRDAIVHGTLPPPPLPPH